MSLNQGTIISSPIRPASTEDNISTAFANEIKGGLHSYETLTERNAIIEARRQFGMFCYVEDGNKFYQLVNNDDNLMNNSNWIEFTSGGSAGATFSVGTGLTFSSGVISSTDTLQSITNRGNTTTNNILIGATVSNGSKLQVSGTVSITGKTSIVTGTSVYGKVEIEPTGIDIQSENDVDNISASITLDSTDFGDGIKVKLIKNSDVSEIDLSVYTIALKSSVITLATNNSESFNYRAGNFNVNGGNVIFSTGSVYVGSSNRYTNLNVYDADVNFVRGQFNSYDGTYSLNNSTFKMHSANVLIDAINATFSTRVSGLPAVSSNQFVTLSQLGSTSSGSTDTFQDVTGRGNTTTNNILIGVTESNGSKLQVSGTVSIVGRTSISSTQDSIIHNLNVGNGSIDLNIGTDDFNGSIIIQPDNEYPHIELLSLSREPDIIDAKIDRIGLGKGLIEVQSVDYINGYDSNISVGYNSIRLESDNNADSIQSKIIIDSDIYVGGIYIRTSDEVREHIISMGYGLIQIDISDEDNESQISMGVDNMSLSSKKISLIANMGITTNTLAYTGGTVSIDVTNATFSTTVSGLPATQANHFVTLSQLGGGGTAAIPSLQDVTDTGNTTNNSIVINNDGGIAVNLSTGGYMSYNGGGFNATNTDNTKGIFYSDGNVFIDGGEIAITSGSWTQNGGSYNMTDGNFTFNGGTYSQTSGEFSINGGSLTVNSGLNEFSGGTFSKTGGIFQMDDAGTFLSGVLETTGMNNLNSTFDTFGYNATINMMQAVTYHSLVVQRNSGSTSDLLDVFDNTSTTAGDLFKVRNSNGTYFAINYQGNVGIGTTNPDSPLVIASKTVNELHTSDGDATSEGGLRIGSWGNDTSLGYMMVGARTNASDWFATSAQSVLFGAYNGNIRFYQNVGLTAGDTYTPTETFTIIGSNGNVGIGTNNPDQALHIFDASGNVLIKSESQNAYTFAGLHMKTNSGNGYIYRNGSSSGSNPNGMMIQDDGNIDIYPATSFVTRFATNGNVGIGTDTPTTKLDVNGTVLTRGSNSGFVFTDRTTEVNSFALYSPNVGEFDFYDTNATASRLKVKSNGVLNFAVTFDYTDNAAALTAGLVAGDVYRTGDNLKIVH